MKVVMIGAGYVGLVSAACFSEFGWKVTCTGKDAERIERLWMISDAREPRAQLLAAIGGTHLASGTLDFPGERARHIYLVDPLGNLMMRFPPDPDPAKTIKDLQRLLKYSRSG